MVNFNAKFGKRWGANDDSERFTFKFGNVDIPSADFLNRILIFQCCVDPKTDTKKMGVYCFVDVVLRPSHCGSPSVSSWNFLKYFAEPFKCGHRLGLHSSLPQILPVQQSCQSDSTNTIASIPSPKFLAELQ